MEKEQPNYYAIIPANVRYDKELSPNAKLLYGEITALCDEKGYCWATNKYFADLYNVSNISISKWIKQLCEKEYLQSEIVYKEGSKEILYRSITILKYPIKEKFNTPIKEKFKENNTSNNNTFNNTNNIKESKKESTKSFDEIIAENFDNEKVKTELIEFIKMRKQIKKPMTNRALELLISKLKQMSNNNCDLMVKLLDQSIEHGWQTIYELKDNKSYQKPQQLNNGFTQQLANETEEEIEFKRSLYANRQGF